MGSARNSKFSIFIFEFLDIVSPVAYNLDVRQRTFVGHRQNVNTRQLSSESLHPWNLCATPLRVVAIAGSAGAFESFRSILSRLPADFSCPVLILQHRMKRRSQPDTLVQSLAASSRLHVLPAQNGDLLVAGNVYVCPPDRHVSISQSGHIEIADGAAFHGNRPSADWLFDSVAAELGPTAVVVILSGSLHDGAIGAVKVKMTGGRVIAQDPASSLFPSMPAAAIATGCVDFILPPERIASALITLAMVPGGFDLFSVPRRVLRG
jgi:two-component system chemotaxis response regulator CheB